MQKSDDDIKYVGTKPFEISESLNREGCVNCLMDISSAIRAKDMTAAYIKRFPFLIRELNAGRDMVELDLLLVSLIDRLQKNDP